MLKILKIVAFSCAISINCWSQNDTIFLTNGTFKSGKILESDRKSFVFKTEKGKANIRKQNVYKLIDSIGQKTTFINLSYLEKIPSKTEYYKILKPISSKHSKGTIRHYYGNIRMKEGDFRLAMRNSKDDEITKSFKNYKRKVNLSHLLVSCGWTLKAMGTILVLTSEKTVWNDCTGKCTSYTYTDYTQLNSGIALIAAGMAEVTTGFVLGVMARSIKQKKLINRYNSLLLQP
ncbi:MAG TPA: hypothetical protein PLC65_08475 [Bacteroidia bacterium]|nr:hypothetical protein [Bacteroidia bacterium]